MNVAASSRSGQNEQSPRNAVAKPEWILTFTRPDEAGREIGRYASRDDAMFAAHARGKIVITVA